MASLQNKADRWYCTFRYDNKRHTIKLGPVSKREAQSKADEIDLKLLRLEQGLVSVPEGLDVRQFMFMDGMAPQVVSVSKSITLKSLEKEYIEAMSGILEPSTIQGIKIHFKHLMRIMGSFQLVLGITQPTLQSYIEKRAKEKSKYTTFISPATIKKEIISLRTAWNWCMAKGWIKTRYPSRGLKYPKGQQKPAYMTWSEIERCGVSWECLYLRPDEVKELLSYAKAHATSSWIYPLIVTAAYTGARRSELLRTKLTDVDLLDGVFTVNERKRVHGTRTTRRVTMTQALIDVLKEYIGDRRSGWLFHDCQEQITRDESHDHFKRTLAGGKWKVVRGMHTFRHSLISALAANGVDQRIIDNIVGHSTEAQRVRYRHITPEVKKDAIGAVFK